MSLIYGTGTNAFPSLLFGWFQDITKAIFDVLGACVCVWTTPTIWTNKVDALLKILNEDEHLVKSERAIKKLAH